MFVTALLAASLAAPVPKALKHRPDAERIEGRWQRQTVDSGEGQQSAAKDWIEVRGGEFLRGQDTGNSYLVATVALDTTQSPRHLDVTWDAELRARYIYRIEGDTLTLCHAQRDQPRPTEFGGGNGQFCSVWKRVTDEKK